MTSRECVITKRKSIIMLGHHQQESLAKLKFPHIGRQINQAKTNQQDAKRTSEKCPNNAKLICTMQSTASITLNITRTVTNTLNYVCQTPGSHQVGLANTTNELHLRSHLSKQIALTVKTNRRLTQT